MWEKLRIKPAHTVIIASLFTFVCMIQSFVRPLYGDVDNYFIALVANKMFAGETQDSYMLHLHPFLCKFLEGIGSLSKSTDCVILAAMLMLLIAIWAITYMVAKNVRNYYELIVYIVVLFGMVIVGDLFHDNYTRWAAFMTGAGLLLLLIDVHKRRYLRVHQVLATVLLTLGMMWRDEAFFVFIPFVCLDFVIVFFKTEKVEQKELLKLFGKIIVVPVICILFLGITNTIVRQSDKYSDAILYDDARVAVVDYAMKDWDEVHDEMELITQNDYESAKRWMLFDTERIDAEYLSKLNDVGATKAFELSLTGLMEMQKRILSVFIDSQHFHYLGAVLIVLFCVGMFGKISLYSKIQVILLYLGADLIFLYLAYVGRAIERGFIPAIYALLTSLAVLFLTEERGAKSEMVCGYLLTGLVILFMGREAMMGNTVVGQSVFTAKADAENKYEVQCEKDALYIWNAGSYMKGPVLHFMEQGKLLPEEILRHHMIEGAWIYGQVYFEQYLERIGVENPMYALIERNNTYYVGEDCSYVLRYLQEHVEENIIAVQTCAIEGVAVWEFFAEN